MKFVLPWIVACLLLAAVWLAAAWAIQQTEAPAFLDEATLKRGQAIYNQRCAGCHVSAREWTQRRCPPLTNIAAVAAHRRPGMSAEEYLLESIVDPGAFRPPGAAGDMPSDIAAGLSADELRDLVALLASLGGTPDFEAINALAIQPLPAVDSPETEQVDAALVLEGEALFKGKGGCSACHALRGDVDANLLAPSMLGVGLNSEEYLRNALLNPHASIVPGYETYFLEIEGQVLQGRVASRTDSGVWFLETSSQGGVIPRWLPADQLGESIHLEPQGISSMPANYSEILSEQEITALLAFLQTLKFGD